MPRGDMPFRTFSPLATPPLMASRGEQPFSFCRIGSRFRGVVLLCDACAKFLQGSLVTSPWKTGDLRSPFSNVPGARFFTPTFLSSPNLRYSPTLQSSTTEQTFKPSSVLGSIGVFLGLLPFFPSPLPFRNGLSQGFFSYTSEVSSRRFFPPHPIQPIS